MENRIDAVEVEHLLPSEARHTLQRARSWVANHPLAHDDLLSELAAQARVAATRVKEAASEAEIEEWAWTNALMAAALSLSTDFPKRASVPGLIYLANFLSARAQDWIRQGDDAKALDVLLAALQMARTYALETNKRLDQTFFALAASAAEPAGRLASEQRLTVDELLRSFDLNITEPTILFMSGRDLSGPRAFAVAHMIAAATSLATDDDSRDYLRKLVAEVNKRREEIAPKSWRARVRFEATLGKALAKASARLNVHSRGGFRWVRA